MTLDVEQSERMKELGIEHDNRVLTTLLIVHRLYTSFGNIGRDLLSLNIQI